MHFTVIFTLFCTLKPNTLSINNDGQANVRSYLRYLEYVMSNFQSNDVSTHWFSYFTDYDTETQTE